MSNAVFLWMLDRGIELGVIVLCLLPLRTLLHRTVSRRFSYLLWLTLPVNVGINLIVKIMPISIRTTNFLSIPPLVILEGTTIRFMKYIWLAGTVIVISILAIRYIYLLRCLVGSIQVQNGIYVTDRIESPFTLGIWRPRIYLPFSLKEE